MPDLYEITCPHCAKVYELPREKIQRHAGSKIQCKACSGVFLMPSLPAEAEQAEPVDVSQQVVTASAPIASATSAEQTPAQPTPQPTPQPFPARGGRSSATQTPWPFAAYADDEADDEADDDEEADENDAADDRVDDAAQGVLETDHVEDPETFLGNDSEAGVVDETVDVEHTPAATPNGHRSEHPPERRPGRGNGRGASHANANTNANGTSATAGRMSEFSDAPDPVVPFPRAHEPAVYEPNPEVAPAPGMNDAALGRVQRDLRSIRRWVQFFGWLVVLAILAAIAAGVLAYLGLLDDVWQHIVTFFQGAAERNG